MVTDTYLRFRYSISLPLCGNWKQPRLKEKKVLSIQLCSLDGRLSPYKGWLRHQENFAQPPKLTQPGWFSICFHRKTTPASRSAEASP